MNLPKRLTLFISLILICTTGQLLSIYNSKKCHQQPIEYPPELNYGMWSYHNINVTLIACPKCGSTAAREYLRSLNSGMIDWRIASEKVIPQNHTVVGIVNAPLKRFISGYAEVLRFIEFFRSLAVNVFCFPECVRSFWAECVKFGV